MAAVEKRFVGVGREESAGWYGLVGSGERHRKKNHFKGSDPLNKISGANIFYESLHLIGS